MINQEQNFWRLFASYEDLTRHQSTAIGEGNFAILENLHEKKTSILQEMAKIAAFLGWNREHPALKDRLSALITLARENTVQMNGQIATTRRKSLLLEAASKRLQAVDHVYRKDMRTGALRAHG